VQQHTGRRFALPETCLIGYLGSLPKVIGRCLWLADRQMQLAQFQVALKSTDDGLRLELFRLPNSLLAEGNSLLIGVDFRGIVCGDKEPIRRLSVVACCLIEERQLGGNRFLYWTALQQGFGDSKTECSSARRSQRLIKAF
jgi:hypothetical protein